MARPETPIEDMSDYYVVRDVASGTHVVKKEPKALAGWLESRQKATLVLADGNEFQGFSFGYHESTAGEVVFNTGMVGYPESLSDPSYAGQILVITFPLVGNYGVPGEERDSLGLLKYFESDKIYLKAVVISDYSFISSHYTAKKSLGEWLQEQKIPGIYGVDTRAITKLIRQHGSILGKVVVQGSSNSTIPFYDPNLENLSATVSRTQIQVFRPPPLGDSADETLSKPVNILAVDCGIKNNIIRFLVNVLRVTLTLVPWNHDFTNMEFDGLFLSNGPGNPEQCMQTVEYIKKASMVSARG